MNPDPLALDDYCGTARLFPLPNLVLFPQVSQPLPQPACSPNQRATRGCCASRTDSLRRSDIGIYFLAM